MTEFRVGQRVIASDGFEEFPGEIVEKNDPDQGDFEYLIEHDGYYSFWPRECLRTE